MTAEIDIIGEKTRTPFLNKVRLNFFPIKQDTIRQKHEKR